MTPAISVAGLSRHYRDQVALDHVSLELETGSITGLLGRNGAGKTTLLRILAGQEFPSSGDVRVLGAAPAENDQVLRRMVFVREDQAYPDFKVGHALRAASWFYPNWDGELAGTLAEDFNLRPKKPIKKLSRGLRSALGITIGLAARAEVTLFDEPYAGLDAVARQIFYDRLLADYAEHPRAILLSTHLIDEAAGLLERVIVIDRGRIVLTADADDLRGVATAVSGPVLAVDEFTAGRVVWDRRRAGSRVSVVVVGGLDEADRLLADYAEFPRTILLSTHLIDEAAALFESVVVIDQGRVVLEAAADGLRGVATTVSGPVLAVDEFTTGRAVWNRRRLGSQASVVMVGPLNEADRAEAQSLGLDLVPLTLQQLVVHAAGWPGAAGSASTGPASQPTDSEEVSI